MGFYAKFNITFVFVCYSNQMSRLKSDHQKQLDRKIKRNTDFDNGRSLEKTESER